VLEKPTPTEAEQRLFVPGLRAGYYLCFFGMHVLTPLIMQLLHEQIERRQASNGASNGAGNGAGVNITLSSALAELARREKYLALEQTGSRYDVGVKYGLLTAQLALALSGRDREEVLARLLELLAQREAVRESPIERA